MACELEEAFDRVRENLPDEWFVLNMSQDGAGWYVTCGKMRGWQLTQDVLTSRLDTRAGTLTKALNRMAEALKEHNGKT